MVNEMAREGVVCVGGAGNFPTGNMMILDTLAQGKTGSYKFYAPEMVYDDGKDVKNDGVFLSFLWKGDENNLEFSIETPDEKTSPAISSGADFIKVGKYNISYAREVSPRGTVMFKFGISHIDSGTVDGDWKVNIKAVNNSIIFRGYVVDISQSWGGSTHWSSDKISDESSIMFPSTADSLIAIGAYVVNFGWFDRIGDLASYSSWGYNLSGKYYGVDITAPGHTTFTIEKDFSYMTFSGTSSAAPHVVGTAALMLQYDPSLTHEQIRQIILNTAASDKFTGTLPNLKWGYGKLDTEAALKFLINNKINN
jgi:subtilisin family serine protease